jgi:hypothetical protein
MEETPHKISAQNSQPAGRALNSSIRILQKNSSNQYYVNSNKMHCLFQHSDNDVPSNGQVFPVRVLAGSERLGRASKDALGNQEGLVKGQWGLRVVYKPCKVYYEAMPPRTIKRLQKKKKKRVEVEVVEVTSSTERGHTSS